MPVLKDARGASRPDARDSRLSMGQVLVVSQIALSLLMLVAAGLFVRTLSNLESIQLGFNRENLLLCSGMNARQAGHRDPEIMAFYSDLQKRFSELPGVRYANMSHYPMIGKRLVVFAGGSGVGKQPARPDGANGPRIWEMMTPIIS